MPETFLDLQQEFKTEMETTIVKHFDASMIEDDEKQEFLRDQLGRFVEWAAEWGNQSQIFLENLLKQEQKQPDKFRIKQAMKLD